MDENEKQKYFDDLEQKVADNGFTTISTWNEEGERFSYTVGLYKTYQHPEMIIFGLPPELSHGVLSDIAQRAKEGNPFDLTRPTDRLFADDDAIFIDVPKQRYVEYVRSAVWFNGEQDFPVCQVVWPSNQDGLYPWEPNAAPEFSKAQPVIGPIP